jgi:hypothetical protein
VRPKCGTATSIHIQDPDTNSHGTLAAYSPTQSKPRNPDPCSWSTAKPGDQVWVSDGGGNAIIGTGQLSDGAPIGEQCVFSFDVPDLPVKEDAYLVQIGSAGQIMLYPDAAREPHLGSRGGSLYIT